MKIAYKQFMRMMDLCADHKTAGENFINTGRIIGSAEDAKYLQKSRDMIEYQETIGWPYKATQAQLNEFSMWEAIK